MKWISCLLWLAVVVANADDVKRLGKSSEIANWEFKGIDEDVAERLKHALSFDYDFLVITHPATSINEFIPAAQENLTRHLHDVGYLDARVTIRHRDDDRVVVELAECTRYTAGSIHVDGLSTKLSNIVIRNLEGQPRTTPIENYSVGMVGPDNDSKFSEKRPQWKWKSGSDAQLSDRSIDEIRHIVKTTLEDEGFSRANFEIEKELTAQGIATLGVRVGFLGPPAIVKRIMFAGNTKDSDAELTSYLKLELGTVFTRYEKHRIEKLLFESGRYLNYLVATKPMDDGIILGITVAEYPQAPRLVEQFSCEQKYCLEFRDRIIQQLRAERDLVIQIDSNLLAIIASNGEWLVMQGATKSNPSVPRRALRFSSRSLTCFLPPEEARFSIPIRNVQFFGQLSSYLTNDVQPFHFRAGWGATFKQQSANLEPFKFELNFPPVVFIALAQSATFDFSNHNETVISIARNDSTTTVIERRVEDSSKLEISIESDGPTPSVTHISFENGAYQESGNRIQELLRFTREYYDPDAPVSSTVRFFCQTTSLAEDLANALGKESPCSKEVLESISHLVDNGLLEPFDRLFVNWTISNDADSSLLVNPRTLSTEDSWARAALVLSDSLFPRYSAGWTVWRESMLLLAGNHRYLVDEFRRIALDENAAGPITCLVIAQLAQKKSAALSAKFSEFGLGRAFLDGYHAETKPILESTTVSGELLRSAQRSLAKISDDDFRTLANAAGMNETSVQRFDDIRKLDIPTEDWLDLIWSRFLRNIVDQKLSDLANPLKANPIVGSKSSPTQRTN